VREVLQQPLSASYAMAVDPLDSWVLTTGQDGVLRQWDTTSGVLKCQLQPELGSCEAARACWLWLAGPVLYAQCRAECCCCCLSNAAAAACPTLTCAHAGLPA
jgi:hypothetical protein